MKSKRPSFFAKLPHFYCQILSFLFIFSMCFLNFSGCDLDENGSSDNPIVCGDGKVDDSEACDDGNEVDGDACSNTCTLEVTDPQSCLEIKTRAVAETGTNPLDGTYTLYVGGDPNKPWEVFCFNMDEDTPLEYLSVDSDLNYSQVGNGQSIAVTSYRRFRIDPITLQIDPLDATFATNTGFDAFTLELPDNLSSIPGGWAQFQPTRSDDGPAAEALADLTGTPFAFSETILANSLNDFFCQVSSDGVPIEDTAGTGAEVGADLRSFRLTAINSNQANLPTGVLTREVADCANLGEDSTFTSAVWPLQYVGAAE